MTNHTPSIFSIATGSAEPIYRQLIEQTRRQVVSGHLAPGDAMPSVRDIAQVHALNPMTVSKAYGMLEAEGLLLRRRGQGMLVGAARPVAQSEAARIDLLRPSLQRAADEARQLELAPATVLQLLEQLLKEKP
jgi:GntR family transcriptional regulator